MTSTALAERLGAAVGKGTSGGKRRNGNGAIGAPSPRDVALDVCRAILAEAGAGTAEHSDDVVLITEAIGERMGFEGTDAENLLVAAQLHDIGKAWVPRRILEKPGPLTDEEWAVIRRHTVIGEEILSAVDELAEVGRLVRHSHERWDGGGYPDGLAAAEIPLGSRIIFCADTFHAIRCDRPYRAGRSAAEALAEISRCSGSQFDPAVATALEEVVRERASSPSGARNPRSSRLLALLMCLVIGGAGTALARSSVLGQAEGASPSNPSPPPACGTAGCPTVAGPVGGLAPVGGPGWIPGPRVLYPGLPGRLHRHVPGGDRGGAGGADENGARDQAKDKRGSQGHGKAEHGSQGHGKAPGNSEHSHSGHGSSSSHGASGHSSTHRAHDGSGSGSGGDHHSSAGGQSGGTQSSGDGGSSGSSGAHSGGSSGESATGDSGHAGSNGSHGG